VIPKIGRLVWLPVTSVVSDKERKRDERPLNPYTSEGTKSAFNSCPFRLAPSTQAMKIGLEGRHPIEQGTLVAEWPWAGAAVPWWKAASPKAFLVISRDFAGYPHSWVKGVIRGRKGQVETGWSRCGCLSFGWAGEWKIRAHRLMAWAGEPGGLGSVAQAATAYDQVELGDGICEAGAARLGAAILA